jgi:hypothetical protein
LDLTRYFYGKGYSNDNIILELADRGAAEREILETALKIVDIEEEFRTRIKSKLGIIYAEAGDYQTALEFLSDDDAEQKLTALFRVGDRRAAMELLIEKSNAVSDKTLFYAIRELYKELTNDFDRLPKAALLAYNLLISGWTDKSLIELVAAGFKGELRKWMALAKVLNAAGDDSFDETILRRSMYLKTLDSDLEKIFSRFYENFPENKISNDYIYFIKYKIMEENFSPSDEVFKILENHYREVRDPILCYALCYAHIQRGTAASAPELFSRAERQMEADGALLPRFKEIRDKTLLAPYIEKNQPFLYKTIPGRKVYLNYKLDGRFVKKEMKYLAFGNYSAKIIMFYGERVTYYFSEESESGAVETKPQTFVNEKGVIYESDDEYFALNNAAINEKLLKYDEVYAALSARLSGETKLIGKLL